VTRGGPRGGARAAVACGAVTFGSGAPPPPPPPPAASASPSVPASGGGATAEAGGPAIEAPGVRQAVRRNVLMALGMLVGCVVLLGATTVYAGIREHNAERLEREGDRYQGEVLQFHRRVRSKGRAVKVGFVQDGELRAVNLDFGGGGRDYRKGERVTVLVDPDDRSNVTLPGEVEDDWLLSYLWVVAFSLGIVGLPLGSRRGLRALRQRRVLARAPWRRVRVQARNVGGCLGAKRPVLVVQDAQGEHALRVKGFRRDPIGGSGLDREPDALVAGDPNRYLVVRSRSLDLVSARPPRLERTGRRWLGTLPSAAPLPRVAPGGPPNVMGPSGRPPRSPRK
jgi:hypothetical protein